MIAANASVNTPVNAPVRATVKCQSPLWCNGWIRFTAAIVSMLAPLGCNRCTSGRRCVDRSTGACFSHTNRRLRAGRDHEFAGTRIGAAHGGWRGLVSGVLPELVHNMSADPSELHAWVGPCIGGLILRSEKTCGVRLGVSAQKPCFPMESDNRKRLVDLPLLTQYQLYACGVGSVFKAACVPMPERHSTPIGRQHMRGVRGRKRVGWPLLSSDGLASDKRSLTCRR